jgi:maleylpyruvate isomerase
MVGGPTDKIEGTSVPATIPVRLFGPYRAGTRQAYAGLTAYSLPSDHGGRVGIDSAFNSLRPGNSYAVTGAAVPALRAQLSGAEQFEAVRFASDGLAAARRGCAALYEAVDDLDDAAMRGPTRLSGWSRGHLVSHLARNADGLVNLLHWARTGIESPMYASQADREADIEEGAHRLAQVQQEDLRAADERFFMATEVMSEMDWEAEVTNGQGLTIPVSLVPWMRLTEVLVHHVDLGVGLGFGEVVELAGEQAELLIDYVVTRYDARPGVPAVRLSVELPAGSERTWLLGNTGEPRDIGCGAASALAWLTGREAVDFPELPGWL